MGYVVKVAASGLRGTWLLPSLAGHHTFGPRNAAEVFQTLKEAETASAKAAEFFGKHGMVFSVEPAE